MNKQQEALKLALEALEETLRTLDDENAKPGGAISDTIWYSEHETLFDYLTTQITAIREALAEQPAQQEPSMVYKVKMCPRQECASASKCASFAACSTRAYVKPEQPAQQQEPVSAIRALTDQCAALIQERDELQKQVWRYEKNGVTCQTYRHKIDRTCSECNVQEDYTSPQPAQEQSLQDLWHKVWPEAGAFVRASADDLTQFAKAVSTSPPASKPWVGLTDEEKADLFEGTAPYYNEVDYADAIEAKLKEKNT